MFVNSEHRYFVTHFTVKKECAFCCDSSLKVGDRTGQITAQMNITDLRALLGIEDDSREE